MVTVPETWRERPGPWLAVGLYLVTIYLTLPLAPAAEKLLFSLVDKAKVLGLINTVMALIAFAVLVTLVRTGRYLSLLLLPVILVGGWLFLEGRSPMERVHILEYALLALMLHHACGRPRGWGVLVPLFYTFLAGCMDETIQGFLPNRYGDIWDVAMNLSGGVLALWLGPLVMREGREVPRGLARDLPVEV